MDTTEEKEFDFAENTFVKKIPNWGRWILFIPASFIGSLLAVVILAILNNLSISYLGGSSDGWWVYLFQLVQSGLWGYLFVLFGAVVIPKGQFIASIVLLIIAVLLIGYLLLANTVTQSTNQLWMLLNCGLTIVGSAVAVYMIHKGEPLFD